MNPKARRAWCDGFAPSLSTRALATLRDALAADDQRVAQGLTVLPFPWDTTATPEAVCGCAIAFCGMASGLETVADVHAFFVAACEACDARFTEVAACRWFLAWFDDAPRAEAFAELLAEVDLELARRAAVSAA